MRAFLLKNKRLIYLLVPLFLYFIYSITIKSIYQNTEFCSSSTKLDEMTGFYPNTAYIYLSWIIFSLASVIYLFFSPSDSYYRFMISLSIIVIVSCIIYANYPIRIEYPIYNGSNFLESFYSKSGIAAFPNLPAAIMSSSFFFILFHKRKDNHSKCTILAISMGILLIIWILCSLFSKLANLLDITSGLSIGVLACLFIAFIPLRQVH